MELLRDLKAWWNAMDSLPWYIKVWASLYPLPQILGGLVFINTLPGVIILCGRVLSAVIQSQIHKRAPFSKLMGPVGHAHWLLIVPYLIYALSAQELSPTLYWFVTYVIATTLISGVIDAIELGTYLKQGHVAYKR